MSGSILRTKLYEDVAQAMQERIRSEQWLPGQRLPAEPELAKDFDVSRSTIREAMRSLQREGLLRTKAGSGTYVADSAPVILMTRELADIMGDREHLHDLAQARVLLEPQLASLAAAQATAEEKAALVQMAEEMCRQAERNRLIAMGYRFHMELARMSHNAVLFGFYQSASSQLRSMRVLESLTLEVYLRGAEDHLAIARAIAAGNSGQAAQAMTDHLREDYAPYL